MCAFLKKVSKNKVILLKLTIWLCDFYVSMLIKYHPLLIQRRKTYAKETKCFKNFRIRWVFMRKKNYRFFLILEYLLTSIEPLFYSFFVNLTEKKITHLITCRPFYLFYHPNMSLFPRNNIKSTTHFQ